MANDKLAKGIAGCSKAIVALEQLLGERYRAMQGSARAGQASHDLFQTFDLDDDGFIATCPDTRPGVRRATAHAARGEPPKVANRLASCVARWLL